MDAKDKLIRNLIRLRKNEFSSRLIKIIILTVFAILTPIIIFDTIQERNVTTAIILIVAEMLFILVAIMLLKSALEFYNIKDSRIYQCIENPRAVTEIVITPIKIVFEIKGMEDETIFLRQSKIKIEIINNITEVFGENKIVITQNS